MFNKIQWRRVFLFTLKHLWRFIFIIIYFIFSFLLEAIKFMVGITDNGETEDSQQEKPLMSSLDCSWENNINGRSETDLDGRLVYDDDM